MTELHDAGIEQKLRQNTELRLETIDSIREVSG